MGGANPILVDWVEHPDHDANLDAQQIDFLCSLKEMIQEDGKFSLRLL